MHSLRIGADVGGTFTDLVVETPDGQPRVFKVPSVPSDPSEGVRSAVAAAALGLGMAVNELLQQCTSFVHGSTVATNTVLERNGGKVGLLTTAGFRDSLEIRRGMRENPWDHRTPFVEPLVPRQLRLGVRGRIDASGREIAALDVRDVRAAVQRLLSHNIDAVAVCFINSYLNGAHEELARHILAEVAPDLPVSISSQLAPIMGEYERSSTTVIDAYVRARVVRYVRALEAWLRQNGFRGQFALVQSNGGSVSVERVARAPVSVCLSGPAAGVGAMRYFGRLCGSGDLISMEIGGTSCDVTLLQDGAPQLVDLFMMGGLHVATPAVEIHTVGAGGGSIARVDAAGLLSCGPQGAGAAPGPACYGRGGENATTTDALVVLGRMRSGPIGDGSIVIDEDLARDACAAKIAGPLGVAIEDAAMGVVELLEQNLLHAVEEISVKRGLDPARFTLIAAGGAGPMHGATVGRALGCRQVYVPRLAGAFCALGMLDSDIRQDFMRVYDAPLEEAGSARVADAIVGLRRAALAELAAEGLDPAHLREEVHLDLSYKGQLRALRTAFDPRQADVASLQARFEAEHRRVYGHIKPITPIRITAIRLVAALPATPLAVADEAPASRSATPAGRRRVFIDRPRGWMELPVYRGEDLAPGHELVGPLIIEEQTTTVFAGTGDRVTVDRAGNYAIMLS